ncbi:MATE family efflux transporter, partial [Burkholderia pseudomallei]
RALRRAMATSFSAFVAATVALVGPLGNPGIWIALLVFMAGRGATLARRLPGVARAVAPDAALAPSAAG